MRLEVCISMTQKIEIRRLLPCHLMSVVCQVRVRLLSRLSLTTRHLVSGQYRLAAIVQCEEFEIVCEERLVKRNRCDVLRESKCLPQNLRHDSETEIPNVISILRSRYVSAPFGSHSIFEFSSAQNIYFLPHYAIKILSTLNIQLKFRTKNIFSFACSDRPAVFQIETYKTTIV